MHLKGAWRLKMPNSFNINQSLIGQRPWLHLCLLVRLQNLSYNLNFSLSTFGKGGLGLGIVGIVENLAID
jgi:hypothetical protein